MAKRFTDTEKYEDPWFCELSPKLKALYLYMLDTCDCAGIWKANLKMFNVHWEMNLTHDDIDKLGNKVRRVSQEIYLIPNFIKFQYGELSENSNVYKGIVKSFKYNGLETKGIARVAEGLAKGQARDKDRG